jgi:hypothetical protein
MYTLVLTAHSWLRWAALIFGILATVALVMSPAAEPRAPRGGVDRGQPTGGDRWGLFFIIALDVQLLLGLLLYFVASPNTTAMFADFGAAMRDPVARFWAVEHISLMLVAVVLAHVGRVLARKAATPRSRRKRLLICFGLATIAMIAATPWPGTTAGRPLFRM